MLNNEIIMKLVIIILGAGIVKWTTPNPCLVLSESDS